MTEALLIPAEYIEAMKADPSGRAERYTHTYGYDARICAGTQTGVPLTRDRWRTDGPVLVTIGEESEAYFRDGAHNLAELLPYLKIETLPGQDNAALRMAPESVAASAGRFSPPCEPWRAPTTCFRR